MLLRVKKLVLDYISHVSWKRTNYFGSGVLLQQFTGTEEMLCVGTRQGNGDFMMGIDLGGRKKKRLLFAL